MSYVKEMNCLEWLMGMPSGSVDLICCDPAYESLEKHRAVGTTTRLKQSKASSNEWFPIFRNEHFPAFFQQCHRVLVKNAHLYVLCDFDTLRVVVPLAEDAGFKCWSPIIWDKGKIGMGYHYRSRYEFVLFFEKGKRKLNDLGVPNVLRFDRIQGKDAYPTEKPVPLLRKLIHQSTQIGDLVADPFAGSGSTGEAALSADRRFMGCDIKAAACTRANRRLGYVVANRGVTPGLSKT